MSTPAQQMMNDTTPAFTKGIRYFGPETPELELYGQSAAIDERQTAISAIDDAAVYQTLLAADALRYLTLQVCSSKESGHPGGFASSADAYAALVMLGHTNIVTEVGHHAPGFYSAMFLDRSLEEMGIDTMDDMMARFRERHGLLGHLSGAIPGLLAPADPLGQGQHFAMAAACLHPHKLFPFTLGDGGMGEPYVLSSMMHFHTAYPTCTNFLPVLVWNGYSQEHHSMVSIKSNEEMVGYWKGHGFENVVLVDAKRFDGLGPIECLWIGAGFERGRNVGHVVPAAQHSNQPVRLVDDGPAASKHILPVTGQVDELWQREGRGDLDAVGRQVRTQGIGSLGGRVDST